MNLGDSPESGVPADLRMVGSASCDPSDALPAVLTVEEIARLLKVNRKTVYDAVRARTIPFARVGRLLRFNRDAVLQWLRGQGRVSQPRRNP
jgi:excisionase family DNA binding protein